MADNTEPRIDWTRDEHILALELYRRRAPSLPGDDDSEVVALSNELRAIGKLLGVEAGPKYRNPNGVSMKLMNFRRFDPHFLAQGKKGLSQGSAGEEDVWNDLAKRSREARGGRDDVAATAGRPGRRRGR